MTENPLWVFFKGKILPYVVAEYKANGTMPTADAIADHFKSDPNLANPGGKYKDVDGNPQKPRQRLGAMFNQLKSATKPTTKDGLPRPKGDQTAFATLTKVATAIGFKRGKQAGSITGSADAAELLAELGLE